MNRRRTELLLLAFAVAVATVANVAVDVAYSEKVTPAVMTYSVALALLFGAAHLAVRFLAPAADPILLPCAAVLNGIGLVFQRRLDLAAADRAAQLGRAAPSGHATQQLLWTLVGVGLFVALLVVVRDHRLLGRFRYTLVAIGLFLLLLPSVLPARFSEVNGAKIWIRVAGFSIQPSEFAKICLIVFFASYFVEKRELLALATHRIAGLNLPRARDLGPVLLAWAASLAVLVREKDLGSSLLFFGIFVVMLYVATERTSWLLIGLGLFAGGATMAYRLFGHVRTRVDIWLDPFQDPTNRGYQLTQGLFGLATGGLTGTGLGNGRPETVPYAGTDFIFATIGEELGLVGVVAVLTVFALFVSRGIRVALGCRDDFGKLLATGLAFSVALQVFVVVGGVTRLIPLTGITLPFLSYGGSSLVANYVIVALLLRISDADRAFVERAPQATDAELTGEMTQVVVMR
ncbi:MAG TPA: FtsW/RodA/SpoVE family cell cycle protein [Frankiaceae bacterium]|nr:FtsW/RodA/SpoVE family cell cycle protein [Frankiaceae bacterium]